MWPVTSSLPFMFLTMFLFVLEPKPGRADGVRVVVSVGSDAILPCSPSTKEDLNRKRFQWMKGGQKQVFSYDGGIHSINSITGQDDQFKGRVSFFPDQLKSGNASIIIRNTQTADSGEYTCDLQSTGEKYIIHLVVVGGVRVVVPEGGNAILPCSPSTKEDLNRKRFQWMKDGQKQVFYFDGGIHSNNNPTGQDVQFKGRVSFFPDHLKSGDASIKIINTQTADSGDYTCDLQSTGEKYIIHLVVDVRVVVPVGGNPILPCSPSTKEDLNYKRFNWMKDGQKQVFSYDAGIHSNSNPTGQDVQFKGRVSFFLDQLKSGDASIIIRNTQTADSGEYTCDLPSLKSTGEKYIIRLVVVAAPKPEISIDKFTQSEVLLRCEVRGAFPKPDVRWQDSDGNVLHAEEPEVTERDGRYHITVYTTVTKTTTNIIIFCVSEQKEISQRTENQIYVPEKPTDVGKVLGIVAAVVIIVVGAILAAVIYIRNTKRRTKEIIQRTLEEMMSRGLGALMVIQVQVKTGEKSVKLPFETTPDLPKDTKVKWMNSKGRIVHLYKNGSDRPGKQDEVYRDRTEMNQDLLGTGDVGLTLKNPTEDDSGQYHCCVYIGGRRLTLKSVLLTVTGRDEEMKLQQVKVESGVESVQLPFETRPDLSEDTIVMWIDRKGRMVHVYGSNRPDKQDQVYRDRTKMKENLLRTGDVSLTLMNPTEDDSGYYRCVVSSSTDRTREKIVKLTVTDRVQVQDQTGDTRTIVEMKPLMVSRKTSVSVQDLAHVQQVKVQSGEKSVELKYKAPPNLPKDTKVMWMDSKDRIVHVYNSSDQPDEQDLVYRNRTKMNENALRTGDVSLTLKNPTEDDSGQYYCCINIGGHRLTVESVLLTVTARVQVQDPTGDTTSIEMKPLMGNKSV